MRMIYCYNKEQVQKCEIMLHHYLRWSCLSVFGSSFCIGSSKGFRGGVTGRGLKCACGMASSCGGDVSLELLAFELPARKGIGMKESLEAEDGLVWSLLLERDRRGHFFLGLSTVDLERGLPMFGSSPITDHLVADGDIPSSRGDRWSSNGTGDEDPERLLGEFLPPCFRLRMVLQRRGFELLKLKFLSESSEEDMRMMGLWGTAGVRKVLPISST